MSRVVVFDLGAVLIDWNPRYLYRKLFADEAEMEHFLATVCSQEWNIQLDAGRSFAQACAEKIKQFPQYAAQIAAYHTRWNEMMGGAVEGTVQILREVKQKGFPVYALSNWSAETFPLAQKRFDFLQLFDGIVLSGAEKCVKPDSQIYHILLTRYRLNAADCIFTDDNSANIKTAQDLGFDAILFTSPNELRAAFVKRGVL
jgi:2-haloacid dehalogenase